MKSSNRKTHSAEAIELGYAVSMISRENIAIDWSFLGQAVMRLEPKVMAGLDVVGTDGKVFAFSPRPALDRFSQGPSELIRDCLHLVVHCLLSHPFATDVDFDVWSVATDIAAEECCLSLADDSQPAARDDERSRVIADLRSELGALSAERIYLHLRSGTLTDAETAELAELFVRDDHALWPASPRLSFFVAVDADTEAAFASSEDAGTSPSASASARPTAPEADGHSGLGGRENEKSPAGAAGSGAVADFTEPPSGDGCAPDVPAPARPDLMPPLAMPSADDVAATREGWADLARRVALEIGVSADPLSADTALFADKLDVATRRTRDWRAFLRRFAEVTEEMHADDSGFDPVFYTYGLRTFGDMPLIEEPETRERKLVRDFVICIDTSASIPTDLVARFVSEAFSMLTASASFASRVDVHILQCDDKVRRDDVLTCTDDVEEWLAGFEARGRGGTDFRPAFAHIDSLLSSGELANLRGVVYFTDGRGTYPETAPAYDTAFVFCDAGARRPEAPPWAFALDFDE